MFLFVVFLHIFFTSRLTHGGLCRLTLKGHENIRKAHNNCSYCGCLTAKHKRNGQNDGKNSQLLISKQGTEHLLHLFWTCEKTQSFWNSLFSWLQSGRIIEKDSRSLEADAALGLRPDNSKYELQINFCFLIAKYFIWICKLKECIPKLNDFLSYLRHFFKIENDGRTVAKKWEPLLPILQ